MVNYFLSNQQTKNACKNSSSIKQKCWSQCKNKTKHKFKTWKVFGSHWLLGVKQKILCIKSIENGWYGSIQENDKSVRNEIRMRKEFESDTFSSLYLLFLFWRKTIFNNCWHPVVFVFYFPNLQHAVLSMEGSHQLPQLPQPPLLQFLRSNRCSPSFESVLCSIL